MRRSWRVVAIVAACIVAAEVFAFGLSGVVWVLATAVEEG